MPSTLKNRTIFTRDNIEVLRGIDNAVVDLIYLDPPFNTNRHFTAPIGSTAEGADFRDIFSEKDVKEEWIGLIAEQHPILANYLHGVERTGHRSNKYYLCYMAVRLMELHRILKPTGSIYFHCDPTMSHYIKILMDVIFGHENFRNEIVWFYADTPGRSTTNFPKKHDLILYYAKTDTFVFNDKEVRIPILAASKQRYATPRTIGGKTYTGGDSATIGKVPENVFTLPAVKGNSKEGVGYPTQKPLALLHRIIKASSNEGDLVLDPFCGCATTCVAAEQLSRQWVGIDVSKRAYELVQDRLARDVSVVGDPPKENTPTVLALGGKVIHRTDIPTRTDQAPLPPKKEVKHTLYGRQEGVCKGCKGYFEYRHLEVDHIVPQAKGGGDEERNLQLLCSSCNRRKGTLDMADFLEKIKSGA